MPQWRCSGFGQSQAQELIGSACAKPIVIRCGGVVDGAKPRA